MAGKSKPNNGTHTAKHNKGGTKAGFGKAKTGPKTSTVKVGKGHNYNASPARMPSADGPPANPNGN